MCWWWFLCQLYVEFIHLIVSRLTEISVMVYCRASASDYDDWETVYGNKGWGSKSLIPLLRKVKQLVSRPKLYLNIGRPRPTKPSLRTIRTENLDRSRCLLPSQA